MMRARREHEAESQKARDMHSAFKGAQKQVRNISKQKKKQFLES